VDRGHAGEDGSFIGTDGGSNLIGLGQDATVVWQQQIGTGPAITPLYATSDGGAIVTTTTPRT
jgi:hypothetical protein